MKFTKINALKGYSAYIVTTSYFTGEGEAFDDNIMGVIYLISNNADITCMSSAYYNGTRKSVARTYLIIPNSPESLISIGSYSEFCDTISYTGIN